VPLTIGFAEAGSGYFNGLIDEVQIYNRALSPSEITAIHGKTGFDYSLSNNGPVSIPVGGTGTVTVTATLISGTPQPVTLSASVHCNLCGTLTSFNPSSVTPTAGGATSILKIIVSSGAAGSILTVDVSGTPLGATTTPTSFSVMVTAPLTAFDYSLSNNGPVSITQGTSVAVTLTAKLTAGTALPVTLSCVSSSLPSGITCGSFTVNPVPPTSAGATSTLVVSVSSSVALGSYTFLVTGSPAGATASAAATTVSVTVSTSGPWTNITPVAGPSPRAGLVIVYDAADGYVLLFGGGNAFRTFGDTWKFTGGSWTNITSAGPSSRLAASMAYDAADGYVILFGGSPSSSFSNPFHDTWKFSAGVWTNITTGPGPSARAFAGMTYDNGDGYAVSYTHLTLPTICSV